MMRNELHNREEERKDLANQAAAYCPVETDVDTLMKLVKKESYEKEDIRKCTYTLLKKFNFSVPEQLCISLNISEFDTFLSSSPPANNKPSLVIHDLSNNCWVLVILIQDEQKQATVLYRDPSGKSISKEIEEIIKKNMLGAKCISFVQKNIGIEENFAYGPLCLRDLKLMMIHLQKDPSGQVGSIRFSELNDLQHYKLQIIMPLTRELANEQEFLNDLRKLIDDVPIEICNNIRNFKKALEKELQNDGKEVGYNKKDYIQIEELQEAEKKLTSGSAYNKNTGNYEFDIQTTFPVQVKKLTLIFEILNNAAADSKRLITFRDISKTLNVNIESIEEFYNTRDDDKTHQSNKENATVEVDDINDLINKLPEKKDSPQEACTPLEELLKQITVESPLQTKSDLSKQLEENYHLVKAKFEKWKSSDITAVRNWADRIKGKLGTSDEAVCETIAVMDRAFYLVTPGYRLRDTQILAVLVFLQGREGNGRLCQIHTGEGKTTIVSLLATIGALQGRMIDVITSNPVLAEEGVEETTLFYSAFGLTVSTNNGATAKVGYAANILYGTISNFQFDYLKDTFENLTVRQDRPFGQVILDEVDSMLIDNGGHIAKLASPFPGMEYLRYIYIRIWEELHKAEQNFSKEFNDRIEEIKTHVDKDQVNEQLDKYIEEMSQCERKKIKEMIRDSKPTSIPLIPPHLQDYVDRKLDVWLRNALHAKYNCHEHEQYRVIKDENGELIVAPVDYLNTGVTLKNTVWSDGLHQFVQLKHNIQLTIESLTSSFISNMGYIKNYEDKNIFGMTGTLGSNSERNLLSSVYNVDYAKIPTYKPIQFVEEESLVCQDDLWDDQLASAVLEKVKQKRAVLVICETEKDLTLINKKLELLKENVAFRIRTYANEESADQTKDKVVIGDIILATNIAGRGTDFKTTKELEANHGLHVCVGFLPCNRRVEEQAFGRTSRQGNNGTAQLVIRSSEVYALGLEEDTTFEEIKTRRDAVEGERLQVVQSELVPELSLKDKLFKRFAELHSREKKKVWSDPAHRFIVLDLKERWALWLDKNDFKDLKNVNITEKVASEYNSFYEREARICLEGNLFHNPYYCIPLAEFYMGSGQSKKAEDVLKRSIAIGDKNLLTGAHMKLFDIAITNGHQILERFKKVVGKLLFLDLNQVETYKTDAHNYLQTAGESIKKEINYVENQLVLKENEEISNFQNILLFEDTTTNKFLQHLYSRFYLLKFQELCIKELTEQIQLTSKDGVDFDVTATLYDVITRTSTFMEKATLFEISELESTGLDHIYNLKVIHDVPDEVVHVAQCEIGMGIACLAFALACPLFSLPLLQVAETLFVEGIMDLLEEIMKQGNSKFDEKEFKKQKLQFLGTTLLTFGVGAAEQLVGVIQKVLKAVKKLNIFLRDCEYLQNTSKYIKESENKLEKVLSKALDAQKVSKTKLLSKFTKDVAEKLINKEKKLLTPIIMEQVKSQVHSAIDKYIEDAAEGFKKEVEGKIRKQTGPLGLMEKLRTTSTDQIDNIVKQLAQKTSEMDFVEKIASRLAKKAKGSLTEVLCQYKDSIFEMAETVEYQTKFVSGLDEGLHGGNSNNDVDKVIQGVCSAARDQLLQKLDDIPDKIIDDTQMAGEKIVSNDKKGKSNDKKEVKN